MFYSDEIYNSVWCDFFNEKELQALLTSANSPKLTNQNPVLEIYRIFL